MPRNLGQKYEDEINQILEDKGFFPLQLKGNLGGNSPDSAFTHRNGIYYLELKNKNAPDFGQKFMTWNEGSGWSWTTPDEITGMYDSFNVLGRINSNFKPNLFTKDKNSFQPQYKIEDQKAFENTFDLDAGDYLHRYYANKNCYYIQIENKGFYYLEQDVANLGVPQFDPDLTLRLRAKERDKSSHHSYSFLAVIRLKARSIRKTGYDIEEKGGKIFPLFQ